MTEECDSVTEEKTIDSHVRNKREKIRQTGFSSSDDLLAVNSSIKKCSDELLLSIYSVHED